MTYILIDGNNLAIRSAFANSELKNKDDVPTGVHFGVFQSLINLKQKFGPATYLVIWDGKSVRRQKESEEAVKKNIIKSAYKANRKKDEQPKPLLDFYAQAPYLKKGIDQAGIPQIRLENVEADDIAASYCAMLKKDNEVILVTSDSDYFQLLDANVSIYDGMKQKLINKDEWVKENNIQPAQYVDVGALSGDDSDNIHGIIGWGDKTAFKAIQEHGSWQAVMASFHKELDPLRQQYPDLKDNPTEFDRLVKITTKTLKPKYPEIRLDMPFTGVTLALEDGKIKGSIPKTTLMALMMEERVPLAYSLKKMDIIEQLPEIVMGKCNKDRLKEYFDYYDIKSLVDSIIIFE